MPILVSLFRPILAMSDRLGMLGAHGGPLVPGPQRSDYRRRWWKGIRATTTRQGSTVKQVFWLETAGI